MKGVTRQLFIRYYLTLTPSATVRVPRVDGARVPRVDGARVPRVDGARVPRVDGARVPRVDGARVPRPAIPENAGRGIRDEHAGAPFVASAEDRLVPASRD